ncbi:cytidyltransferase [Leptotrichia sp. OH3620_COT-345]|uniref:tRNA(Met) cytidine acetate ligase n=1 Tax=Leptotrichia sp. OH3620_COT-345 TaxID=2491048 RepID=UPI000F64BEAF|nr:nucleotidyltransferase family protein [Leptotrichia sp. OH3620_COT-345]RRD39782.1 cytidyltransferase [Leptotrichia sp. OH3620_COT-345]
MRVGIVAEYNPFHNGHLYQINKIKEKFGKDIFLIAVISGDFVQRGEISFLNKWEKTEISLENGIDLVVELPLYYSIQNAEIFSKMATKILDYMEVDMQIFGAEEENIEILEKIVDIQSEENYKKKLMYYMKKGNSYSAAQKLLLKELGYDDIVKPNNILGLEYIRTMKKNKLKIKPYIIKREISEYNELEIEKERKSIASATFIRNKIENNESGVDLERIKKFVPNNTYKILKEKTLKKKKIKREILKDEVFKIVKYKFLTYSKKEIIKIYDTSEEIYARIYNGLKKSLNYEEFVKNVKSRNFSIKRIERIMMNILLNIRRKSINYKIDYVRVLGFNDKGRKYLKNINKNLGKKIFVNWKDIDKNDNINREKINIEKNGFLIKELLSGEKEKLNPLVKTGQEEK